MCLLPEKFGKDASPPTAIIILLDETSITSLLSFVIEIRFGLNILPHPEIKSQPEFLIKFT